MDYLLKQCLAGREVFARVTDHAIDVLWASGRTLDYALWVRYRKVEENPVHEEPWEWGKRLAADRVTEQYEERGTFVGVVRDWEEGKLAPSFPEIVRVTGREEEGKRVLAVEARILYAWREVVVRHGSVLFRLRSVAHGYNGCGGESDLDDGTTRVFPDEIGSIVVGKPVAELVPWEERDLGDPHAAWESWDERVFSPDMWPDEEEWEAAARGDLLPSRDPWDFEDLEPR